MPDAAAITPAPARPLLPTDSVSALFAQMAESRPDAVAVIEALGTWTYAALDAHADRIAGMLQAQGVGAGQRVGLLLPRSADAVASMLAVMRLGAAFVPLDLGYPAELLALIAQDSAPAAVLAQTEMLAMLGAAPPWSCPTIDLTAAADELAGTAALPLPCAAGPDTAAYVMYTSGSTGRPKGVITPHRGILRLVLEPDYVSLGPDEVMLHLAPLAFDASTFEIWGALLNGGRLAVVETAQPGLDEIAEAIARHGVTIAWLTAGLFNLMVDHRLLALRPLRQLLAGGDVLSPSHVARALGGLPGLRLINGYGPTENTTFTCCHAVPADFDGQSALPIGTPIRGTDVWIMDDAMQPVADGAPGQLVAGGDGVALGYLNRPEQTAQAFVPHPARPGAWAYCTGDRVRRLPDGSIAFLGRADRQVKLNGKRIELDEIENVAQTCPAVRDVVVVVRERGARKLIAAYVAGAPEAADQLRAYLRQRLPDYMVPTEIVAMAALPLTPNGKIDRKRLPEVAAAAAGPRAHGNDIESALAAIWQRVLGHDRIARDANFFDLGGTSLQLIEAHALIQQSLAPDLAITDMFRLPRLAALAGFLAGDAAAAPAEAAHSGHRSDSIAIIGLSGRFPGAADARTFWQNLRDGRESIRALAPDELEDAFPPATRASPAYVAARPILDGVENFDPAFFGMHLREAELTDPQHRLLLECAWEALEDGGYDPQNAPGRVAVFAGSSINTYFLHNVCQNRDTIEQFTSGYQIGGYPLLLGAGADFLATRIAYKLNLRGPAITVQSACSTSLLAVAQACDSLLSGAADMALAGGVSISFPQHRGYLYQEGGMGSPDGHCRAFDAQAAGTVFGAGAGVVLLKRLADALADGDSIYAVIRGTAVNNDGAAKVGYTAPSEDGQAAVIAAAHAAAGVAARDISYVECHGTGTPLGDPIEFAGLQKAFRANTADRQFCALGSVKTNVGHLDVAAGVTGLIKTALALHHRALPATLHYTAPNPRIDFAASPFFVNATLRAWDDETRLAGVSAFGVGGTNVHVVMQSAPLATEQPDAEAAPQLLVLSARSEAALAQARLRLADHLRAHPEQRLADIAATLQTGRHAFAHRCAVVARDHTEAAAKLDAITAGSKAGAANIAFMFPGQGSQHIGMGRALYDGEDLFRRTIDTCAEHLRPLIGQDLRTLLYAAPETDEIAHPLMATVLAQPAIFAVEYAMAQLLRSWGLHPSACIGHSVGEVVAACLAGVMSLPDALRFVALRGQLMQAVPPGAMLAVRMPEPELAAMLPDRVDIAAVNAPALCVAAGPFEAIDALAATIAAQGGQARLLHTSHAFHSAMMDEVVAPLAELARSITLHPPALPIISCVTGATLTDAEATDPAYWARHSREKVAFAAALQTLMAEQAPLLVDVGPGRTLATLARQGAARGSVVAAAMADAADTEADGNVVALEAVGRLWAAGAAPDWTALHHQQRRRVSLPTTPYDRVRCWIARPARAAALPASVPSFETSPAMNQMTPISLHAETPSHAEALRRELLVLLESLSGEDISAADPAHSFIELGFDSLFLGQFAQQVAAKYSVPVAFRDLQGRFSTPGALAAHLATLVAPEPVAAPATLAPSAPVAVAKAQPAFTGGESAVERLMRDQLQTMQALMASQLEALRGVASQQAAPMTTVPAPKTAVAPVKSDAPNRFDVFRPGTKTESSDITPAQLRHIAGLVATTTRRTPGSKAHTQAHRRVLADPRVAAGFRSEWKEMVYPIVVTRSKGSRLWDVDGNEYIDLLNGFGQTAFGHRADFVTDAIRAQLDQDFAIGPQTPIAGEVAELFCEITGNERVTFCNTGSEAVMAAMRLARTVTGRKRIVSFAGDYHGQFDEVLIKGAAHGTPRALPVAPGIPPESVSNMVVLPYAKPESLAWIRENASSLAAVILEPVQSRHPDLQPREFLHELRAITEASGTCLVFDEVVTGFRMHPAGMQKLFDIRADLATYGKVAGGGMPVGILAGKKRFMDALDGGFWEYGDESYPEVAPTFFAGTFVRHPLVMAAVRAVLQHIKAEGPAMQEALAARTAAMVATINADLARRGIRSRLETCGSLFYFTFVAEDRLASLLYYHLRNRGVHIQEGFPCFLTTAHCEADFAHIVRAFSDSLDALQSAGILCPNGIPVIAAAEPVAEARPTEPQAEVYLAAQMGDAASCAFNESVSLTLEGSLDAAALEAALNDLVARHDALRARFGITGEAMHIAPTLTLAMPMIDLAAAPDDLAALVAQDAATPFDLALGPLLRVTLVRLAAERHVLVLTAHHIVCDGWSINVLASELAAAYTARRTGAAALLQPAVSFGAYARQLAEVAPDAVDPFWLAQFADSVAPLDLPTDRPRPAQKSFRGATHQAQIDAALTLAVKKAGARLGCTLFATLLGTFQAMIGRLSGQNDVVVAIPSAGQAALGEQILVGHCVNLLPLRASWTADTTLSEHLKTMRQTVLDATDRQTTLGTLVRALDLPREPGRVPLAEVQFNLERLGEDAEMAGLRVTMTPNPKSFANFDIFLNVIESASGLRLDCDYNTDLFDAATIDRWIGHFRTMLEAVASQRDMALCRLPMLSEAERADIARWNDTAASLPAAASIHALVEAAAAASPDAVAAMCGAARLTYRDLDEQANRLAHHLRATITAPDARIAVMLRRTLDLPVALLAVMKAGMAYVPLDPSHPEARLRLVLETARVAGVVADADMGLAAVPAGLPVLRLDRDRATIAARPATRPACLPEALLPAERTAYVIFTSGSTGTPKGVAVSQRAAVNLLAAMARTPGLAATDTLLAVTTVAFDIAALELFLPLTVGARLMLADDDAASDAVVLLERLREAPPTIMQATPALWRILLELGYQPPAGLRMLCGGEALTRDLADRLTAQGGMLWNMYGPTETTIWSACERILPDGKAITIGRPIANTGLHVLDAQDQPAAIGVIGHLHITGLGLAQGYFDRPDLTDAAFRQLDIDGAATRAYRTGDVARRLPDGRVVVLGRSDSQIKLRGFRIELGDIEAAIAASFVAAGAAVLDRAGTDMARLVGYYVDQPGRSRSAGEMMEAVGAILPGYMVPTQWVRLDQMPLTPNGKIDRRALPPPGETPLARPVPYAAPRTERETAMAGVIGAVLGLTEVGLHDNLFALGADSVQVFQIVARLNRAGITLAARHLMQHPTIAALAIVAESGEKRASVPSLRDFARLRQGARVA